MAASFSVGRCIAPEAPRFSPGRLAPHRPCSACRPMAPSRPTPAPATTCHAARRRMIIKRRTPPAAKRKKRRYRDEPHQLDLEPTSPRFSGRLTTEVNSANGPLQLARLVQEYGMYFSGTQLTMALSRLAAFATFKSLETEQMAAQARATRRCVLLLRERISDCDLISYARASYALGRLGVYDEELMRAVVAEVYDKLNLLSPDSLAALVAGLAALGHRPSDAWLDRFALEVYTRFGRFNGQELANVMYGLARLQYSPSAAWAERCMECFRAAMSLPSVPPMAPAMVKFAFGLASLQIRPSFNWCAAFIARARLLLDTLSARELAVLLWALSRLLVGGRSPAAPPTSAPPEEQEQVAAVAGAGERTRGGAAGAADGSAGGPATAAAAAAAATATNAGVDRAFLDAWFRCSARRMSSANAPSLVLALQALAVLQVSQLPSKYVTAVMEQLRAAMPGGRLAGGAARRRADAAQEEAAAVAGPLGGPEVVSAVLSLVALRIRPGPEWMEACLAGLEVTMADLDAPILSDLGWALARLQYQPSEEWVVAFTARCSALRGALTLQQRGLLSWALRQLRLQVPDFLGDTPASAAADESRKQVANGGEKGRMRDVAKGASVSAGPSVIAMSDLQSKVAQFLL